MTPTGSWPMVRPLATGYSPLRMWTSVPQIVVVVIAHQRVERADVGDRLLVEHDAAGLDEDGGLHLGHVTISCCCECLREGRFRSSAAIASGD